MAKVEPEDVDLIIMCTSTADDLFGSACLVRLGDYAVSAGIPMLCDRNAACPEERNSGMPPQSPFVRDCCNFVSS